jgi:hypothetical protein
MVRHCYPKKVYYVSTGVWYTLRRGGFRNFIRTPSLQRALSIYHRCKVKTRQIDVREKGVKPFALMWEKMQCKT